MTIDTSDDFEDTDSICLACIADEHLRRLSQSRSQQSVCCACQSAGVPSIQIADLAEIVDAALRRYFTWGAEVQKFRDENDDSGWTVRRGSNMSELLQVVLPENFPIHSTLQRVITERDPSYDSRGGGEPFWSDEMRYQEMQPTLEMGQRPFKRWPALPPNGSFWTLAFRAWTGISWPRRFESAIGSSHCACTH